MRHARLRTLRLLFGLTEQEMAVRMGMSEHAYAAWETPERSSRSFPLFAIRLAEQFDVPIDWIVTGGQPNGPRNDNVPKAPGGGPLGEGEAMGVAAIAGSAGAARQHTARLPSNGTRAQRRQQAALLDRDNSTFLTSR